MNCPEMWQAIESVGGAVVILAFFGLGLLIMTGEGTRWIEAWRRRK